MLSLAVRVLGIGLVVTGVELLPSVRDVAAWQRTEAAAGRLRVRGAALAGGALLIGGCCAVWPASALHGGGLLGGALILALFVLCRPSGDGADLMLALLLLCLGGYDLLPADWLRTWLGVCVLVNVGLAYWWSGVAKLRVAGWRSGRALALTMNSRRYGRSWVAWPFLDNAWLPLCCAWPVMVAETGAPLFVAVGGWVLVCWAITMAAIHLGITVLMGLPRFFWAFCGALLTLLALRTA